MNGANLNFTNLSKANLSSVALNGASLVGADLSETSLYEANLSGAWLNEAKGLSAAQLCRALTLWQTKMDTTLRAEVEKQCPEKLQEP